MMEKKATYFEQFGEKNTDDVLNASLERLRDCDIKHVVVASHRGVTAMKAAEKFKSLDVNIVAVTVHAGAKPDVLDEWKSNAGTIEKLGVKTVRGTHTLSGIERAVKARWGGVGQVLLMGDTLRIFGEGMKVGVETLLMAADSGCIPIGKKIMVIAGTSRGADTSIVVKSAPSTKFFDLAMQEIVCKPYTDGVKHGAR